MLKSIVVFPFTKMMFSPFTVEPLKFHKMLILHMNIKIK
jgi:hypothetical protein